MQGIDWILHWSRTGGSTQDCCSKHFPDSFRLSIFVHQNFCIWNVIYGKHCYIHQFRLVRFHRNCQICASQTHFDNWNEFKNLLLVNVDNFGWKSRTCKPKCGSEVRYSCSFVVKPNVFLFTKCFLDILWIYWACFNAMQSNKRQGRTSVSPD